jgi:hypothetical protein
VVKIIVDKVKEGIPAAFLTVEV